MESYRKRKEEESESGSESESESDEDDSSRRKKRAAAAAAAAAAKKQRERGGGGGGRRGDSDSEEEEVSPFIQQLSIFKLSYKFVCDCASMLGLHMGLITGWPIWSVPSGCKQPFVDFKSGVSF